MENLEKPKPYWGLGEGIPIVFILTLGLITLSPQSIKGTSKNRMRRSFFEVPLNACGNTKLQVGE